MMQLSQAAQWMGAEQLGPDAQVLRVVTDSRNIRPGDLFVALGGENFDAHDFVAQALASGAVGAVVAPDFVLAGAALLRVADPLLALGQLAQAWRACFTLPLIGVTGSNGKTSVKEMIRAICAAEVGDEAVLATQGNLNNHIGLPLTLLQLRAHHRYAVIEMGMNHLGEIRYLTQLARPTVAVINNALRAHMGFFTSVTEIAQAKGEIVEGVSADGVLILNHDDPHLALWRALRPAIRVCEFGWDAGDVHVVRCATDAGESTVSVLTPQGEFTTHLKVAGEHMVRNAVAASAVAHSVGIDNAVIAQGLSAFSTVKGRMHVLRAPSGATVIDDSYNANPDSVRAALRVLASYPAPRYIVLGDMRELGTDAPALHAEIGAYARGLGIEHLWALGSLCEHACAAFGEGAQHFASMNTLSAQLQAEVGAAATVLVKGSNSMQMWRAIAPLLGRVDAPVSSH